MNPLIGVDELAELLGAPATAVCDVRWYLGDPGRGRREYDEGHVPGAVFVDLAADLADPPDPSGRGGRHPLPTPSRFATTLGRLGISPDHLVVAYDAAGGAVAARLWWMLRSIGHDRVRVLDGGFAAWVEAGHAVSTDVAAPDPVTRDHPAPDAWRGTVDADAVARSVEAGTTVIDARAAERYRGDHEPIDPRAGHVPGAVNLPHLDTLGADGRHRPVAELRERFSGLGPTPVVYCGSGVTACHDLLAMEVAGVTDGRLYPGSWSDWSADPDRPVATGAD